MKRALVLVLLCLAGCGNPNVRTVEDVAYVDGSDHDKHRLDLYLPVGKTEFPVVHFVHGGYWHEGDRDYYRWITGLYGSIAEALAAKGIGGVVQSYRLSPEVKIEGQLDDVVRAVNWTLQNVAEYGGDPGRVVLMGHSAGGHLISLLGLDGRHFERAGVDVSGVRGYVAMSPVLDLNHMRASKEAEFNAEVTDVVFGDAARLTEFSPASYLETLAAPLLVLYGEHDYAYLREQIAIALERCKELGLEVESGVVSGYTHSDMVLRVGEDGDAITPRVVEFVRTVSAD